MAGADCLTAPIKVAAMNPPEGSVPSSALCAPVRLTFSSYEGDL